MLCSRVSKAFAYAEGLSPIEMGESLISQSKRRIHHFSRFFTYTPKSIQFSVVSRKNQFLMMMAVGIWHICTVRTQHLFLEYLPSALQSKILYHLSKNMHSAASLIKIGKTLSLPLHAHTKHIWEKESFAWTGNFLKMPHTSKKSYCI